jgi:Asp-tRNA(Asn)/Glu-tRNA(Gln) amidotransferase A subunit family amidase
MKATTHETRVRDALDRAGTPAAAHVFTALFAEQAIAAARAADQGQASGPLAGLPVSVKDLYDIAGRTTLAGSVQRRGAAPAPTDALAVQRLRAAGAAIVGLTNMSEFAFSGVGLNPHYGTPRNPTDEQTARIPGGSSSGAAVSVALGMCFAGLGSDTAGSIRIPAALCGIVGFKNTARLTPLAGALPLSTTLDTACALTRSVRDAILVHEVLAARRVAPPSKALRDCRFAVATTQMLDGLDAGTARAFERALRAIRAAGATVQEIPLDEIRDLGTLQATGGFAAAESYRWHRHLLAAHGERYDPRVRTRIERGAGMKAWEYLDLVRERAEWIDRVQRALHGFDAVLSPTVPVVAPALAEVAPGSERDEAFFRINALLLRNPSVVNMLDGCAISVPCQAPGDLPAGLMIWHGALQDDAVLNIAVQVEAALALRPAAGGPA